MSRTIFLFASAAALLVGCADYRYQARTAGGSTVSQQRVALDAGREPGSVAVRATGFAPLPPSVGAGRALRLVVTVRNDGAAPWQLSPAQQTIVLPDGTQAAPRAALVAGAPAADPVDVPPGATRTVELYYAPPPDEARASQLPAFVARWQVETADGPRRGETRFARVNVAGPTLPCGAQASAYCLAGYTA